ncbi:MAG: class I SAM-dependent methyltransferase [Methylacidiphilales bacterium]|nr:class I SAM-dependent methyltransferase [Candidatus Methylacidiphilales bacterium]
MNPALDNLVRQEIADYLNFCRDTGYQPPAWILPEPSCALLKKICALSDAPIQAFEFGSGRSTLALRSACVGVTSVEDSAEWLAKTEEFAAGFPKRDTDFTAVVPLTACPLGFLTCKSFDLDGHSDLLRRLQLSGLILIDSPPNPATREHALILALRHARPGAIIVLDDLEIQTTFRFATRLGRDNSDSFDFLHVPIDHGLGFFEKKARSRLVLRPSLREIIGAWFRN